MNDHADTLRALRDRKGNVVPISRKDAEALDAAIAALAGRSGEAEPVAFVDAVEGDPARLGVVFKRLPKYGELLYAAAPQQPPPVGDLYDTILAAVESAAPREGDRHDNPRKHITTFREREAIAGAVFQALSQQEAAPSVSEAIRDVHGKVIRLLASLVTMSVSDELCERELLPRDRVMETVMRIREAMNELSVPSQQEAAPSVSGERVQRLRRYYEVTQTGIAMTKMALMSDDPAKARAALDRMSDEIDAVLDAASVSEPAASGGQHCPKCRFTMSGVGYCVNCRETPDAASGEGLPELPAAVGAVGAIKQNRAHIRLPLSPGTPLYTAEQMRAYAIEARRLTTTGQGDVERLPQRLYGLHTRFLSDTSSLPDDWQDWREEYRRDLWEAVEEARTLVEAARGIQPWLVRPSPTHRGWANNTDERRAKANAALDEALAPFGQQQEGQG